MSSAFLGTAGAVYLAVEIAFYVCYKFYLVPRANKLREPAPYRDYGNDRHKLLLRIMRRIEEMCEVNQTDVKETLVTFLNEWFHTTSVAVVVNPQENQNINSGNSKIEMDLTDSTVSEEEEDDTPDITPSPSSSPENSDDDDEGSSSRSESSSEEREHLHLDSSQTPSPSPAASRTTRDDNHLSPLFKQDMNDFFSWAFFGRPYQVLDHWEHVELNRIYDALEQAHGLTFAEQELNNMNNRLHTHHSKPRCMSFEPMNSIHRPLLVYLLVILIKIGGGVLLYLLGFRRHVSATGLVAWHRPAKSNEEHSNSSNNSNNNLMPLLFFHGIAPGGLMLYLPMLFGGFITERDRPIYFFENHAISCTLNFTPLTEEDTVDGVLEILNNFGHVDSHLSVMGHSFGSCPVTWLLSSNKFANIRQVVLLDPVTILLSEPDVMTNFLYANEISKIRMVASSELFTEYYLRRHFAWYNSEIWLEDINEKDCKLLVCLAEKDEIINARKVKQEVQRHSKGKLLFWEGAAHADCVTSPSKWRQVKQHMLEQELELCQQTS